MAAKKKGLTIGILLGKPERDPKRTMDEMDEKMGAEMADEESDEEELPAGFSEAVSEFRSAEDDESAAKALYRAIQLCEEI